VFGAADTDAATLELVDGDATAQATATNSIVATATVARIS
jgi:hypothetical protein